MRGDLWRRGVDPASLDPWALLDVAWLVLLESWPWASSREELITALTDVMDEPPVYTEETFGMSAADQRRSEAMYELAGGPAPMKPKPPPEPE